MGKEWYKDKEKFLFFDIEKKKKEFGVVKLHHCLRGLYFSYKWKHTANRKLRGYGNTDSTQDRQFQDTKKCLAVYICLL